MAAVEPNDRRITAELVTIVGSGRTALAELTSFFDGNVKDKLSTFFTDTPHDGGSLGEVLDLEKMPDLLAKIRTALQLHLKWWVTDCTGLAHLLQSYVIIVPNLVTDKE